MLKSKLQNKTLKIGLRDDEKGLTSDYLKSQTELFINRKEEEKQKAEKADLE